jgi:hypothetical protein
MLQLEYPEHTFIRETQPVHNHIKEFIGAQEAPYTLLMCDDEVMYRPFDLTTVLPFIDEVLTCSLRLGTNITYNFPNNRDEVIPSSLEVLSDDFIKWQWNISHFDFGYPMSVTDHIFSTHFLKDSMKKIMFRSVNSLESSLDSYKQILTRPGTQSWMMSPKQSVFYSIPYNLVQTEYAWNRTTTIHMPLNEAVDQFIKGNRISLLEPSTINACHMTIPYGWLPKEFIC